MILRAKWVVPIVGPPIPDGVVSADGDRITAVSRTASLPASNGTSVQDLGDVILTPGLVNPHTHLELTGYAGKLPPAPLWEWFPPLMKLRQAPGQIEREQQGVYDGAWQSLRAGVTCVGDISRRNLNWRVLRSIPIRKVCYAELLTLAEDPPRNVAELRVAFDEIEEDPLLTAGVTPHAPYTVPPAQIRAAIELAAERRRPWCTHWAETREECEFLRGHPAAMPHFMQTLLAQCGLASPRASVIDLLERCTDGLPPGILAHWNYAGEEDGPRLAAGGHTVVYCPRSHAFFGHPSHPFARLLRAGARVALGTDSAASNESLHLLEEVRFVRRQAADAPAPDVLLRMITLEAARALGWHAQIGSLEPGKQADLAAFPCPADTSAPLIYLCDLAPRPSAVWVAGRRVV